MNMTTDALALRVMGQLLQLCSRHLHDEHTKVPLLYMAGDEAAVIADCNSYAWTFAAAYSDQPWTEDTLSEAVIDFFIQNFLTI